MSTIGNIFDGNIILTCFTYFLGYPPLLLTNITAAKNTDITGFWLGVSCVGYICAGVSYFGGVYIKKANVRNIYISNTNVSNICDSSYKSNKYFI